jgi:hypothetical protein
VAGKPCLLAFEAPGIGLRGFTPSYLREHTVDLATAERETSGAPL